jgi:hypothetical protein
MRRGEPGSSEQPVTVSICTNISIRAPAANAFFESRDAIMVFVCVSNRSYIMLKLFSMNGKPARVGILAGLSIIYGHCQGAR